MAFRCRPVFIVSLVSTFICRSLSVGNDCQELSKINFVCSCLSVCRFKLALIWSRKGISPPRSHGTVLETLASHGSSCLITNVLLHHGYTNFQCGYWLWFYFITINHRISACCLIWNLNKLSPSLHYLSVTSSLLRLSLPPILHTILVWLFPFRFAVQYRLLLFRTKPSIAFLPT